MRDFSTRSSETVEGPGTATRKAARVHAEDDQRAHGKQGRAMSPRKAAAPAQAVDASTPVRLRWTVSPADVSCLAWVAEQDDVGQSIRTLVRESIEREGCVDVYNRPVDQKPRQGRPPGPGTGSASSGAAAPSAGPAEASPSQPRSPRAVSAPHEEPQDELEQPPASSAAPQVSAIKRRASQDQAVSSQSVEAVENGSQFSDDESDSSQSVPAAHRQLDINEVMRSTRR